MAPRKDFTQRLAHVPVVKVTVEGAPGSGKSAIIQVIEEALTKKGFPVEIGAVELLERTITRDSASTRQRLKAVKTRGTIVELESGHPSRSRVLTEFRRKVSIARP